MKIGILGAGHIGKTLALKLTAAGHEVKVSNSRGPDTIDAAALASPLPLRAIARSTAT